MSQLQLSPRHISPYDQGWQAYSDGSTCEYADNDERQAEWHKGWDAAKAWNKRGQ